MPTYERMIVPKPFAGSPPSSRKASMDTVRPSLDVLVLGATAGAPTPGSDQAGTTGHTGGGSSSSSGMNRRASMSEFRTPPVPPLPLPTVLADARGRLRDTGGVLAERERGRSRTSVGTREVGGGGGGGGSGGGGGNGRSRDPSTEGVWGLDEDALRAGRPRRGSASTRDRVAMWEERSRSRSMGRSRSRGQERRLREAGAAEWREERRVSVVPEMPEVPDLESAMTAMGRKGEEGGLPGDAGDARTKASSSSSSSRTRRRRSTVSGKELKMMETMRDGGRLDAMPSPPFSKAASPGMPPAAAVASILDEGDKAEKTNDPDDTRPQPVDERVKSESPPQNRPLSASATAEPSTGPGLMTDKGVHIPETDATADGRDLGAGPDLDPVSKGSGQLDSSRPGGSGTDHDAVASPRSTAASNTRASIDGDTDSYYYTTSTGSSSSDASTISMGQDGTIRHDPNINQVPSPLGTPDVQHQQTGKHTSSVGAETPDIQTEKTRYGDHPAEDNVCPADCHEDTPTQDTSLRTSYASGILSSDSDEETVTTTSLGDAYSLLSPPTSSASTTHPSSVFDAGSEAHKVASGDRAKSAGLPALELSPDLPPVPASVAMPNLDLNGLDESSRNDNSAESIAEDGNWQDIISEGGELRDSQDLVGHHTASEDADYRSEEAAHATQGGRAGDQSPESEAQEASRSVDVVLAGDGSGGTEWSAHGQETPLGLRPRPGSPSSAGSRMGDAASGETPPTSLQDSLETLGESEMERLRTVHDEESIGGRIERSPEPEGGMVRATGQHRYSDELAALEYAESRLDSGTDTIDPTSSAQEHFPNDVSASGPPIDSLEERVDPMEQSRGQSMVNCAVAVDAWTDTPKEVAVDDRDAGTPLSADGFFTPREREAPSLDAAPFQSPIPVGRLSSRPSTPPRGGHQPAQEPLTPQATPRDRKAGVEAFNMGHSLGTPSTPGQPNAMRLGLPPTPEPTPQQAVHPSHAVETKSGSGSLERLQARANSHLDRDEGEEHLHLPTDLLAEMDINELERGRRRTRDLSDEQRKRIDRIESIPLQDIPSRQGVRLTAASSTSMLGPFPMANDTPPHKTNPGSGQTSAALKPPQLPPRTKLSPTASPYVPVASTPQPPQPGPAMDRTEWMVPPPPPIAFPPAASAEFGLSRPPSRMHSKSRAPSRMGGGRGSGSRVRSRAGGARKPWHAPPVYERALHAASVSVIQGISAPMGIYRNIRNWYYPPPDRPTIVKAYPVRARLPVRIFFPTHFDPTSPVLLPTLLTIHAGGFTVGAPADDDGWNRGFADSFGMVVVALNYAKAPWAGFPCPLRDVEALYHAVMADESLPIDRERTALCGFDAGANLALALTQQPSVKAGRDPNAPYHHSYPYPYPQQQQQQRWPQQGYPSPRAVVSVCGILDFTTSPSMKARTRPYKRQLRGARGRGPGLDWVARVLLPSSAWSYIPYGYDAADPLLSPAHAARADLPPHVFVVAAELDCLAHESWRAACRWAGRAVPISTILVGRRNPSRWRGALDEGLGENGDKFAWEEREDAGSSSVGGEGRGGGGGGGSTRWLLVPDVLHGFDRAGWRDQYLWGDEEARMDAEMKTLAYQREIGEWLWGTVWRGG